MIDSARFAKLFMVAALSGGIASWAYAGPASKAPATAKKPAPVTHKLVSADTKKKLAERLAGFKFGMTKDDVIAALSKQLDDKYAPQIAATTDIEAQDRLRQAKKRELADIQASYVQFEGKRGGWDVSVVEDEFAHNTNESLLVRWENSNGKNDRRFFFFFNGRLWKMFISLDLSILPADKRTFETAKDVLTGQYGAGDQEPGKITWHTDEFDVRAIDKFKTYTALALSIVDWKAEKDVLAARDAHPVAQTGNNAVVNAVVDKDGKDHPDVHSNNDAVDAVINANGGKK